MDLEGCKRPSQAHKRTILWFDPSNGQRGDKQLPIPVIVEDRFPLVAAVYDVVNRARILNA